MRIILILSLVFLWSCASDADRPWKQWQDEEGIARYFIKAAYERHPEVGYPQTKYVPNTSFPTQAFWEGQDGWVKLELSIDRAGKVTSAKVIDSQPEKVFDQYATRHFYASRYVPFESNGQTIDVDGIKVKINFTLDKTRGTKTSSGR